MLLLHPDGHTLGTLESLLAPVVSLGVEARRPIPNLQFSDHLFTFPFISLECVRPSVRPSDVRMRYRRAGHVCES